MRIWFISDSGDNGDDYDDDDDDDDSQFQNKKEVSWIEVNEKRRKVLYSWKGRGLFEKIKEQ